MWSFSRYMTGDNKLTYVAMVVCFQNFLRDTQTEVLASALKPMILVANVWSTESRGVIYNINSITPCCDRKCN